MSISSYSELQTAVGNWMARTDLTSRIPEFIALCESKLNRDLSHRKMEQRSQTTVDTSSTSPEFISLPGDFRSMRWIRLSGVTGKPHLDYLSPTALDEMVTARGNGTGQPEFFTIVGDEIELCPQPDTNYVIEMMYRKYIPALSSSNTSNWLLTLAPDIYLYGSLLESEQFIGNDDRIPVWKAGYMGAVDGLNKLNITSAFNAGPVTMRPSGVTP